MCGRQQFTNTVEEADWKNLFTGTNLTISVSRSIMYQNIKFDGNKQYDYMEYDGDGFGLYHEVVTNDDGSVTWYEYGESSFEGDWMKAIDDAGNGGRMRAVLDTYFYPFANAYKSFTYDAESKQYTASSITLTVDGTDYTYTDVCVKIENGKLIELTYISGYMNFTVSEVGTTVVELPIIKYTADEEEWNSIMNGAYFDNVRVSFESNTESGEYVSFYELNVTEDKIEAGGDPNPQILLAMRDGVWYKISYDYDIGEYFGVACERYDYSVLGNIKSQLGGHYNSFTYDEVNNCYVAKNFEFVDGICQELRVHLRGGRLVGIEQITTGTVNGSTVTLVNTYEFLRYGNVSGEYINVPEFTVKN